MNKLIRTDSVMLNPNETNEYYNDYFPVGVLIMAPRKRNEIIKSLNNEFKKKYKKVI